MKMVNTSQLKRSLRLRVTNFRHFSESYIFKITFLLTYMYVALMLNNFFGSNLQKYYVELATLLETELYSM